MKFESARTILTNVEDNGRRGEPLPGCDCVQCFGYCMVDHDVARRDILARGDYDVEREE